jgi:cytidylate kinase
MTDSNSSAKIPVIAIDGPSGSGKGTISRRLASQLGLHFLDSGALYRVLAYAARQRGIDLEDEAALAELGGSLEVTFPAGGATEGQIMLCGRDVSSDIRSETCGNDASRVAALVSVRRALLDRQRVFRQPPGLVADGRDMGTVVFPDAIVKVFLTASPEERARRRYNQLKEKGISASLEILIREVAERDHRDSTRAVSPLRPADDACILDTSSQDVEQSLQKVLVLVEPVLARISHRET